MIKEAAYYEKEVLENEHQLQQMKSDNRDPYDIKKFQEVLGESQMMIPDSICRRDKALTDLKEFLTTLERQEVGNESLNGSVWMVEARKIVGDRGGLEGDNGVKEGGDEVVETAVDDLAEGEAF